MSKIKNKLTLVALLAISILAIMQLSVKADTNEKNIIIKKADKEYIIYYENICKDEFEFAFSLDANEKVEDLNFMNSGKDKTTQDSLNIAYIDENLYDQYFSSGKSVYMWIKNGNDEIVVTSDEIKLTGAIDDAIIDEVNNITKKIDVDTTQTHETQEDINGVDTTVITGKLVITENADNYYYQLVKVTNENYIKLFDLAEKIKEGTTTETFAQFDLTKQFYDLYTKLVPTQDDADWIEVSNMEILQPEDTLENDKYIVWLKQEKEGTTTIDAQFLVSTYQYENRMEPEQIVLKETVKLPVTYDSIALFVILAIIIIAIAVVVILKVKSNKKEENK